MRKLILLALPFSMAVCDVQPVAFAADENDDPVITADEVLDVMASLPPSEACLSARMKSTKGCQRRGGFEHGPDAKRIAEAIVLSADARITGDARLDASLMAVYSSFESGNKADAVGDHGRARGAMQLWYADDATAFDPMRAIPYWRSVAVGSLDACKANPPDERLASVAGSCSYLPARTKVRLRLQAARDALAALDDR